MDTTPETDTQAQPYDDGTGPDGELDALLGDVAVTETTDVATARIKHATNRALIRRVANKAAELQATPPEWLAELRRSGPHPRPVVAQKLGISISGLARGGVTGALSTAEIKALLEKMPEWLRSERATQAAVRQEAIRVKSEKTAKAQLKQY